MKIIFRLEHVILNFGLYKIHKEDYPILNYSNEYLEYHGWGEKDIDLAMVGNSSYALRRVNERLLIKPYAKVDKYLKKLIENGHKVMFVSELNKDFCSDFLKKMGLDDVDIIHSKACLEIPTEEIIFVSADLEEVSELCQSKNIYGLAALWGTTDWMDKDFEVNGVLEKIEDLEELPTGPILQEYKCQAISKWMRSDLLKFRNDSRDACICHMMKCLMENGVAKKSGEKVIFLDCLEKDWNNPFLPYTHINLDIESFEYYIDITLKTRKGLVHLYLQEVNYINYLTENGRKIKTPGRGSSWTAREVALLKFYIRHKIFDKKYILYYPIRDLLKLLPGRTEAGVHSKMKELGLRFRVEEKNE